MENLIIKTKKINISNRMKAFDFARGFALLLMIQTHVIDECGYLGFKDSLYSSFFYYISTPLAAPVFVFIMGIFFQISNKTTVSLTISKGIKLIILGYLLNVCRYTIPSFFALKLNIINSESIAPYTPLSFIKILDILQFAGLAIIFMAIIKRFIKHSLLYLFLALLIGGSAPFLWNKFTSYPSLNFFLELLWGQNDDNNFPIFPWLSFALFGMAYGSFLKNKSFSFLKSFLLGIVPFIIGVYWLMIDTKFIVVNIHTYAIGSVRPNMLILMMGSLLMWIPVCQLLTKYIPTNFLFDRLYFWSKNVTSLYFIQWAFIGWLSVEIGNLNLIGSVSLFLVILIATDRLLIFKRNMQLAN